MFKEFLKPDKGKLAIFALLFLLLMIPIGMIGSAVMEKADSPSSQQPLLESLEETLGPFGQFIIAVCFILYLFVVIGPIFFFAVITQSSPYGFVLGIITTAFLLYIIACLLNAIFLWIIRKTSANPEIPG